MHLLRRAGAGALALTTAFVLAACSPQDNGNNTLAGSKSPAPTGGGPQTTGAASGNVTIEMKDNEFVPKDVSAKGGSITIELKNTGVAPHTFTANDLHADQDVQAGKDTTVTLSGVAPGTYKFFCKYHESLGMVGQITVS